MAGAEAVFCTGTAGGDEIEEGVEAHTIQVGAGGRGGEPAMKDAAEHGARQCAQRGESEGAMGIDPGGAVGPGLQGGIVLLKQLAGKREAGKGVATRLGGGAPGGDEVGADPVAKMGGRGVGGVLSPRPAGGTQGVDEGGFVEGEQRAQVNAAERGLGVDGTRGGEPSGAGAAGETHEQRFGDVVTVMAGAERGDAAAAQGSREEVNPCGPGQGLGRCGRRIFPTRGNQGHT